jgi:uncharacterized membrane protein required for colicin V production
MTSVDIVLVLVIAGAFVLGFLWGVIRSLLMLAAWFVVFVLAAILSVPFGDYLSNQWNTYSTDWNHMAAFGILYVGGLIISLVLVWIGVRGPQGVTKYKLLDDVGSGALMAFVGVLGIAGVITILATAHAGLPGTDTVVGPGWTRDMYFQLLHNSQIGSGLSDTLIPALGSILGLLLPGYVREVMV